MKTPKQISQFRALSKAFLTTILLAAMVSGCTDDNAPVGLQSSDPIPLAQQNTESRNSSSNPTDYTIQLTVVGTTWTYLITKKPGAKDLSHFILNFNNCGNSSANISNILWATVNGQPAVLENSEGNTGCNVNDVTSNFVKFDDLPAASSYTIVFELDTRFGNFVGTNAWLKAGNSCFAYPVLAPCCPY